MSALAVPAVVAGCAGGPTESTSIHFGDVDFTPRSTLYAQFDAAVGGVVGDGRLQRFARAIAFDADIACDDVDESDCDAEVGAGGTRLVLDLAIDQSLLGPARVGDYPLDDGSGSTWQVVTGDGRTFTAGSGKARVYRLDDDAISADYTVDVSGAPVEGALAADRCPALDRRLSGC